jgi:hypothetical protein
MNPARQGPELSTGITFNISSLPRRVMPSRLKRSYSEESLRRRAFGNENESEFGMWAANNLYPGMSRSRRGPRLQMHNISTKEIFPRNPAEDFSRKRHPANYCPDGESEGVSSVVSAGDSVVAAGASVAAGLVISVAAGGGVVGAGVAAGATVSVFCSHATRSAAPARMQMYFFMIEDAHSLN